MSISYLYHTVSRMVRDWRPRERVTRRRMMVWVMVGIFMSRSVYLHRIAAKLPSAAKLLSVTRRVARLLANPRLRVREWYDPIARRWLAAAARTVGEVRLILDPTRVSVGHQWLLVALAFQRRAVPIAWTWLPFKKGHSSAQVQLALLAHVHRLVPPGVPVIVVGDTEFEAGNVQAQLDAWGWGYVLRQKPNNQVQRPGQRRWERLGDVVQRGQSVWLAGAHLTRKHARRVNVLAHWASGEAEAWLLATNRPSRRAALQAYRRRMWIDELFGDLKGHGFDLEHSRLQHFLHLSRLTLAVVLLYLSALSTGVQVIKRGRRHWVDRHDRRDLSIFQIGLRWLERCLVNEQRFALRLCPY
jgi:hypothetical protein